jgi:plasmid replication initiation protein
MKRQPPKHDAQMDLFMPAFGDIAVRDSRNTMEFPFFSLAKNPRFEPLTYENERRGITIHVSGGKPNGIATIWDKDFLIWIVSQVREALDRGEAPSRTVYFHPYQLLKAIRRSVSKRDYERMERAFIRLGNTTVHTTLRTDDKTYRKGFHWIEDYSTARENKSGEAAGMWSVTLANWLFKAALNKAQVLTLDDDYFLLTGGRERWLYLTARKHGGRQDTGFTMLMRTLHAKCGTDEAYKYWAREIRKLVKANELPGYYLALWRGKDGQEYINFTRRSRLAFDHPGYRNELPRWIDNMTPDF